VFPLRRDRLPDGADGGVGRGTATGPQPADLAVGSPVQREDVSAEPRRSRFDDVQGGRGGDRGVEGVAPVFEHRDARPRREGLAGRDDAVRGVDGRAPRLEAIEVRLHAHDTDGAGTNTSARSDASDGRPGQA